MKKKLSFVLAMTNIALYLTCMALWIAIPEVLILNSSVTIASLILTAFLILMNKAIFKRYYLSPQFSKFTSSFTSIFLIFFILGLLNYLTFKHPLVWDFSARQVNSLADQTNNIVKSLTDEVELIAFDNKDNLSKIEELLELYRIQGSKIKITLVDVELNPAQVSQYQITQVPTLIVKKADKIDRVLRLRELEITNSLVKVTREKKAKISFLIGHSEMTFETDNVQGGSHLVDLLRKSHFEVDTVNLLQDSTISESTDVLVIWGAKAQITKEEVTKIDSYLEKGGKLLIGLDPQLNGDNLKNLRDLVQGWGIRIRNNLVIDKKSFVNGSNGTIPLVSKYPQKHDIVANFKSQTFFPLVSSLSASNSPMHKGEYTSLIDSTPASWGESNPMELVQGNLSFNKDQDFRGPLSLGGVWRSTNTKTRIVAFGNSTFLTNKYKRFGANFLLALNSLSWLSEQDRMISFNQPIIEDTPLFISKPQMGTIFYFSVVFMPILFFFLAFVMYWKRRRL